MKRDTSIFQMPIFIISLTLLLLNDFWWKQTFHNFLTGKISDFAGLVVFPLFFTAFLPQFKKSIFLATALLFIFWKSEISESFVLFLNQNHIPCSLACLAFFAICATSRDPKYYYRNADKKKGQYLLHSDFVVHKTESEILGVVAMEKW